MSVVMVEEVKSWLLEAGEIIKNRLKSALVVEQKTSVSDVVTNVDKEIELFLVNKIKQAFPNDQILGEEGVVEQATKLSGRVWVIDPIDGTLNFVKQKDHFCVMLALYEEEVGKLGFIYEVMRDELLWGGKDIGVYLNSQKVPKPSQQGLQEGIINVNTNMFASNSYHTQDIAQKALGVRMVGCAGIAFKEIILNKQNAYISFLRPWDFAPGKVLAEELGIAVRSLSGNTLSLHKGDFVLVALPKTNEDISRMIEM